MVASSKGKNEVVWFFVGCLLGIFGIILIALLPSEVPTQVRVVGSGFEQSDSEDSSPSVLRYLHDQPHSRQGGFGVEEVTRFDERRWKVLKEVDEEIAGAAERISSMSPSLENELAEKYLVLNDKSYLLALERQLAERFAAKQREAEALTASLGAAHAESSLMQLSKYNDKLAVSGQMDPDHNVRVVRVEPYLGSWKVAQGGIKVTFENGKVFLINGRFKRVFAPDTDIG